MNLNMNLMILCGVVAEFEGNFGGKDCAAETEDKACRIMESIELCVVIVEGCSR
jgi:hypothetical protein